MAQRMIDRSDLAEKKIIANFVRYDACGLFLFDEIKNYHYLLVAEINIKIGAKCYKENKTKTPNK